MDSKKSIDGYCCDLNRLSDFLTKYVNSYRLLIGGACELNQITPARRSDVKHALERVNKLGDIIDDLLDVIDECQDDYIDYCKIKACIIKCKIKKKNIEDEICGKRDCDCREEPKPKPPLSPSFKK